MISMNNSTYNRNTKLKDYILPNGYRFTKFISQVGRESAIRFITREYGADFDLKFNEKIIYYGLIGPDRKIKGICGILRLNWYISELKHFTVSKEVRGRGFGQLLSKYVEDKVKTALIVVSSKNPQSTKVATNSGFNILEEVTGPSKCTVRIFVKKKI